MGKKRFYKKGLYTLSRYFKNNQQGFTLIEAAIALTILGLIAIPLVQSFTRERISETNHNSRGKLSAIQNSINQHAVHVKGAYPCPADLSKQEGDSGFGEEIADCSQAYVTSNIKKCNNPAWFTSDGVCKTSKTTSDTILIGGVPFSTLKTHPEAGLDVWGNKIFYAVTFSQTENSTFVSGAGKIKAMSVNIDGSPPDLLPTEYDFVLFSTGASGIGGYSSNGTLLDPCGNPNTEGYDNENCDLDDVFFLDRDPNLKEASARAFTDTKYFYDDYTLAQDSIPEFMWFQHVDNPAYVGKDYLLTLAARTGIGTEFPEEKVHVAGKTRIQSALISAVSTGGWLKTDMICNDDGSICFDPEIIAGSVGDMQCDSSGSLYGSQAVKKVANSAVSCASGVYDDTDMVGNSLPASLVGQPIDGEELQLDTSIFTPENCRSTGKLIKGINLDGTLECYIE